VEELLDLFSVLWAFIATHEDAFSIFFWVLIAALFASDRTHPLSLHFGGMILLVGIVSTTIRHLIPDLHIGNSPWYIHALGGVLVFCGLCWAAWSTSQYGQPDNLANTYMIRKPWLSSAFDAFKSKDYDEVVEQFRKQADRGDFVAQYNLGIIHETGVGEKRSDALAQKYYREAAKKGLAEAQLQLATILTADLMMERKPFMRKPPEPEARSRLLKEGYMWCWLAAAQKHRPARKGLRQIKKHMLPKEIDEAKDLAIKWRPDFSLNNKIQMESSGEN
jgi:hypothetical protein